jgi:hypothetical protein
MSSIRSISRVEPGQFALVTGVTYVFFGIIAAVLMFLFTSMMPATAGFGSMVRGVGVIFLPIIYGVLGYIFGFIGALVYNVVAGVVGGIKFTVTE